MTVWVNVGCGPHRAPEPWINLDVHDGDGVHPDRVVKDAMFPLAEFEDESVDRVYMGHVLEHVPWREVDAFFADIKRALRPGGEIAIVGPDLLRTIELWHVGREPWDLVEAVMESEIPQADLKAPDKVPSWDVAWPEGSHKWNCHEGRVVWALEASGWRDVTPRPLHPVHLGSWPVVAYTAWQCAATAVK